jgi:hypothetical protein
VQRFSVTLPTRIQRDFPGAGAGVIESPGAEDAYAFTVAAGQSVYFDLQARDEALAQNRLRLLDDDGAEIFNTCMGCSSPGVQSLTRGGAYTLIVGNPTEASIGGYTLEIGLR